MFKIDLNDLSGQILLATPSLSQGVFKDTVIFLCSHSDEGAMGIIINKPLKALSFSSICKDLKIENDASAELPILFGGPVEKNRGVVLHSQDYNSETETIKCTSTLSMTASFDILSDLAKGLGPINALLALGYAGWAPGQLESELASNCWMFGRLDDEEVFSINFEKKWSNSLKNSGVEPSKISSIFGTA
jgi:putative transcriptional regulator